MRLLMKNRLLVLTNITIQSGYFFFGAFWFSALPVTRRHINFYFTLALRLLLNSNGSCFDDCMDQLPEF